MTHIKITLDNEVKFDGELGEWVATPPEFFRNAVQPGARPQPWMKGIMLAVTDAIITNTATDIGVRTGPKRWTMTVGEL